MKRWIFKMPLDEMETDRLRDELADILFVPDDEIDIEALELVLEALDRVAPIVDITPVEERLEDFHKRYAHLFQ